jgi:hypothetical protein
MKKAEIISKTLAAMRDISPAHEQSSDESDYEKIVVAELERRLPDGVDIRTCEDFGHLNVQCCDTCHNFYPHYEMKVIALPDGSPAWVCDAVEWAIYPERYQELQEWSRNSPEGNLLRKIFGEDVDE